ncbi:uncharacterized protein LOC62_03G004658 [Vanrija pseudolonga]|uniref:Uncharacterized protein n=1 Tax=Vanrija pseudolonga TaxID=143232 RepID=A0AAF0YAD3_9TREE|nr:hypothetical protein LOC62_03G004658 [Vanrija pseudolonga]
MIPVIGPMHRRRRARRRAHAAAVVTAIGSLVGSASSSSSSNANSSSNSSSPTDAPSAARNARTTPPREYAYATYHGAGWDGTYGSALPSARAGPSNYAAVQAPAYAPEPASASDHKAKAYAYAEDDIADAPDADALPPSHDDVVPRRRSEAAATCARDGHDAHKCDKGIVCRRCGEQV